jgi:hypothetical protein
MGLPEDDPIITRAQYLWSQAEAQAKPYTEQDVTALAKAVYGEASGLPADEQALVVWCALQRVDAGYGSIQAVVTAPRQFAYKASNPVTDSIRSVCEQACKDWSDGKQAPLLSPYATSRPYLWFTGGHYDTHGVPHNVFRDVY